MVSGHFTRLARGRLQANADDDATQKMLRDFIGREESRQAQLEPTLEGSKAGFSEARGYIDLMQLCDTLSLYVCCGATSSVEMPQQFGGQRVRVRFDDGVYETQPSLFGASKRLAEPLRFHVAARGFPSNELTQVEIRIR
jgi:hypothetical protein